jgi:hypothetical protein
MRWSTCLFRGFAKGRGAVHEPSIRFDAEAVQVSICQVVAVGKCQAQSAAGARHRSDHRPSPGLRPLAVSHHRPGRPAAFCDFAGPGDESVLALCDGNRAQIVDAWRKLYDSKGREKLESKADLAARGVESPDRADALIGAIVLGQAAKADWKEVVAISREIKRQMRLDYLHTGRGRRHIEW